MIDVAGILELAGKLTVVGLLFLALVVVVLGLLRRWWLPYYIHAEAVADLRQRLAEMTADRDEWKGMALRQVNLTEAAVGGIRHVAAKA